MKAIDAVRECWDAEKGEWKECWMVHRVHSSLTGTILPTHLASESFIDGSEWEVMPPPLADDEIELGGRRLKIRVEDNHLRIDGMGLFSRVLLEIRPESSGHHPNGWPRAMAYFDKHAPPPKVTLREAMVALLKGEVTSALCGTHTIKLYGTSVIFVGGAHCAPSARELRILAGIDPDDGPAEWELVR